MILEVWNNIDHGGAKKNYSDWLQASNACVARARFEFGFLDF